MKIILFRKLRLKRLLKQKKQVEEDLHMNNILSSTFPIQNESWMEAEKKYLKHLDNKISKLSKENKYV